MKQVLGRTLLAMGVLLVVGCNDATTSTTPSNDSTSTMNELNSSGQGSQDPSGSWLATLAPDDALQVTRKGEQLVVAWDATIDTDLHIDGKLDHKGAGVYAGKVNFASGDSEKRMEDATLRFDAHGQTLSLELRVMWEDTIMFRRGATGMPCQTAGEQIVERSATFQALAMGNAVIGVMPETDEPDMKVQDYRIYESHDENIVTLARLRVDFGKRQLLEFNVAEDSYAVVAGAEALFEGVECR
ncbi:MAG TPA: hypothetical protein VHS96_07815 [Bacteroidia bacterium]|nr:hypothetical protein [Bacteroidia bacterium]